MPTRRYGPVVVGDAVVGGGVVPGGDVVVGGPVVVVCGGEVVVGGAVVVGGEVVGVSPHGGMPSDFVRMTLRLKVPPAAPTACTRSAVYSVRPFCKRAWNADASKEA